MVCIIFKKLFFRGGIVFHTRFLFAQQHHLEHEIGHPARFPEKLAEFFILSGSIEGDVVLDPFSGSGTTAAVAQRLNRVWIGIDANSAYCRLATLRLEYEKKLRKEDENDATGD